MSGGAGTLQAEIITMLKRSQGHVDEAVDSMGRIRSSAIAATTTPAGWATATIASAFGAAVNAEISRLS